MINPKPSDKCHGCKEYGLKCHCLCHELDLMNGPHDIVYHNGEGSKPYNRPGEE